MLRHSLLALGLTVSASSISAQAPRRTGVSSFEFQTDSRGCPRTVITNTRFLFAESVDDTSRAGTVLRETVTTRQCLGAEGKEANLVMEAWPVRAPASAPPLFVISVPGEGGEVGPDGPWYRVLEGGCCGTGDLWRYFSLGTGRELFAASLRPIVLWTPRGDRRLISVHDSYSARMSPETERDSTVIAVIQYGTGNEPSRRAVARKTGGGYWTATALFFQGATTAEDSTVRWLTRTGAEGASTAAEGATIVLILESLLMPDAPPMTIEIPIIEDRLALERSRSHPAVRLSWADASR
jgi:hypothetical protein